MDFQYYMPVRIVSGEDCVKKMRGFFGNWENMSSS